MEMVKFQDMPYERPDFEAMKEAYRQAAEELKSAGSYEEARKICFDIQNKESAISTMASICSVRNTIDMTGFFDAGPPRIPGGLFRFRVPGPVRAGVRISSDVSGRCRSENDP